MKLRKITVTNVRSFLNTTEFSLEGDISIIIGPNGGGKTNLLDSVITVIKRHIMPPWKSQSPGGNEKRLQFSAHQNLDALKLEKHTHAPTADQIILVEVEVSEQDIENILAIKNEIDSIEKYCKQRYMNVQLDTIRNWNTDNLTAGTHITYTVKNDQLQNDFSADHNSFVSYFKNFEWISHLREESGLIPLSTPLLYLPVNRAASGFQASVALSSFNYQSQKQSSDITTSRMGGGILALAIGRIAQKHLLLLHTDSGMANEDFYNDPQMKKLTEMLEPLEYSWRLECIDPLTNNYDVKLEKQGTYFSVQDASSGEKEILNYLFIIYALNVRDALIIVDEPELHLHPKWQKLLLSIFEQLSITT
jgi:AAA15 family ATPase/GTPase